MSKVKTAEQEVERLQKEFDTFDQQCKDLTQDAMNKAPLREEEPQTKITADEAKKMGELYLKPEKSINTMQKFNEKFRDEYNYQKEYVCFIAENKEIIGESIELWTRRFGGLPAEFWKVPVNRPVWGPRYLAEQIAGCKYHRLKTANQVLENGGVGTITGGIIASETIQRLDATPYTSKKQLSFNSRF